MIGNLLTFFAAITSVFMRDRLSAGTVGLMITCALQITHFLNLLVRTSSDIEANIVSVERINEYAELTPEADWKIPETKPPPDWPTVGSIQSVIKANFLPQFSFRNILELRICLFDIEIISN